MKYVPAELVEPLDDQEFSPNAIRVQVCYLQYPPNGGTRGYYLDVTPVEMLDNIGRPSSSCRSIRFVRYQVLFRQAGRFSTKAFQTANTDADAQVDERSGAVWDAVMMVAERARMAILPLPSASIHPARRFEDLTPAQQAAVQAVLDRQSQLVHLAKRYAPRNGSLGIGSEQTRHEALSDALNTFRTAFWEGCSLIECFTRARATYIVWVEKFNATRDSRAHIHVPQDKKDAPPTIWWAFEILRDAGL